MTPRQPRADGPGRALALYRRLSLLVRLHNRVRAATCPFRIIERFVPPEGVICDLGCGHGLFSIHLALASHRRRIVGMDLSAGKIAVAREAAAGLPAVEFRQGDILDAALEPCDAVLLLDVLYLLDPETQDRLIARCRDALKPGGTLLIHTSDTRPRWKYIWAYLQETLAVRVFGVTIGRALHFRGRADLENALRRAGFGVRAERADRGYPYPHLLLVASKGAS